MSRKVWGILAFKPLGSFILKTEHLSHLKMRTLNFAGVSEIVSQRYCKDTIQKAPLPDLDYEVL